MDTFYVTLRIEAENPHDADKVAEGISDTVECPIEGVYPGHDAELDNYGQVVIYTGYYHPTHGG